MEQASPAILQLIEQWVAKEETFSAEVMGFWHPPSMSLLVYFYGAAPAISMFDPKGHEFALNELSSIDPRLIQFGTELGQVMMTYGLTSKTYRTGGKFQYKIWPKVG